MIWSTRCMRIGLGRDLMWSWRWVNRQFILLFHHSGNISWRNEFRNFMIRCLKKWINFLFIFISFSGNNNHHPSRRRITHHRKDILRPRNKKCFSVQWKLKKKIESKLHGKISIHHVNAIRRLSLVYFVIYVPTVEPTNVEKMHINMHVNDCDSDSSSSEIRAQ